MKAASVALFASLCMSAAPAMAQPRQADVPIEADAIISDTRDYPRQNLLRLVPPAVEMIRANGWRCDSISALRPMLMARGFVVVCNRFNYTYELRDRGGNWVVELK